MSPATTSDTASTTIGFGAQFVGQILRAVLLARLLSPADFGRFLILRSVVGVVALVAQSGLGPVGMRRIAAAGGDRGIRRGVAGASVRLAALFGGVAAALTAAAVWLSGFGGVVALSLATLVLSSSLLSVLAALGRGLGLLRVVVAIDRGLSPALDVLVLAAMLLRTEPTGLRDVLLPLAVVSMVPVMLLAWQVWRATRMAGASTTVPRTELLAEAWPVTVNGLLSRGLAETDLWLVGGLLGAPAAAVYGVASRLATALQTPLAVGAYALAPRVAALHAAGSRDALQRLLRRAARRMAAAALGGYIGIAALGGNGLASVFGPTYRDALPIFLVLGLAQIINAVCGIGGTTLLMIGRQKALMAISFCSGAMTLAGGYLLILHLGSMGAALATAGAIALQNILVVRAVRRHAGVRVHL